MPPKNEPVQRPWAAQLHPVTLAAILLLATACVPLPAVPSARTASSTPATAPLQVIATATPPASGEHPLAKMPAAAPAGVNGADSIGDGYAAELGNAGYDIQHYRLALAGDPAAAQITGTVTISATSTLDRLGRIRLDLAGYLVDQVRSAGSPLRFYRSPHKLYLELPQPVDRGEPFSIEVDYHGVIEARP